jgi:uncharacterized protein (DUF2336 family)
MTTPLPLIDDLERALASGSNEKRLQTLWQITDLFISGAERYSPEQIGLFDEVIGKIAAVIETKARAKLASRLAPIATAPVNVVRSLAFDDDIEVAYPVLSASQRLSEADLLANANSKSQDHLLAISERPSLSEALTDVLVTRGGNDVVHSVVRNSGARFSDAGFRMMVKRSSGDEALASQLGLRRDMPRQHFLKLLEQASATVRKRLAASNPHALGAVDGVMAEVVGGIRSEARDASPDYATAKAHIEALFKAGKLNEAEVYRFARERKFEETAVALSLLCNVSIDLVERALLDVGNEIVLILVKVAGLSSTSAKAILLLRAADRGMSAQDLEIALTTFSRLQLETARRVLGFYDARRKRAAESAQAPVMPVKKVS